MISKFRNREKRTVGSISTASLPDVIFMLLFFFMVTTTLREVNLKVEIKPATANQVNKIEDKSLVSYIYIGKPLWNGELGDMSRIQLNDAFAEPHQIRDYIAARRELLGENDRQKMVVSLKIDKNTEMGIVTDVKQELRTAGAFKICYVTTEGDPVEELNH